MSASSSTSATWSEGELSLDTVAFGDGGIYIGNDYHNKWVDDLDDYPIIMAAKVYDSLSEEQRDALNRSLTAIWSAFVGPSITLTGGRSCANNLGVTTGGPDLAAGEGLVIRVPSAVSVRGTICGPDDTFAHMTKVTSAEGDGEITFEPGVTYIIHGEKWLPRRRQRYELLVPLCRAQEQYGVHSYDAVPEAGCIWSIRKGVLKGTMHSQNGTIHSQNGRGLCKACCSRGQSVDCNEKCLNNNSKGIKYVKVGEESSMLTSWCPGLFNCRAHVRRQFKQWLRAKDRQSLDLSQAAKDTGCSKVTLARMLATSVRFDKDLTGKGLCWTARTFDGDSKGPDCDFLEMSSPEFNSLHLLDTDGKLRSLHTLSHLTIAKSGPVCHVSLGDRGTGSGESTAEGRLLWGGEVPDYIRECCRGRVSPGWAAGAGPSRGPDKSVYPALQKGRKEGAKRSVVFPPCDCAVHEQKQAHSHWYLTATARAVRRSAVRRRAFV
eukprot:IDg22895t1